MDRTPNSFAPVRKWRPPGENPETRSPQEAQRGETRKPTRATTPPARNSPAVAVRNAARNPAPRSAGNTPAFKLPFGVVVEATSVHKFGLFCCCGFLLSGAINDFSNRLLHTKAYLSFVFGIVVVLAFLVCGTALRGMKSNIGKFWGGLAVWLVIASVFSIGRGDSIALIKDYITKIVVIYFYCTAFILNVRNCRTLFTVNIVTACYTVLSCALFGDLDSSGRMIIGGGLFQGNSNDLALSLVCNLGFFMYMIWQKSALRRIIGVMGFVASIFFLLKTGSRGGFLALAACLLVWFIYSNKRGILIALIAPAILLAPLLSPAILARLVSIEISSAALNSADGMNQDQASQAERTRLLQKSVIMAITHPVFGVGPGRFTDALWLDDVANKTHTAALGTHNSYTQLASECGLPALLFYLGALIGAIRLNLQMLKRARTSPKAEIVFTMSVCLLGNLVAYAVSTAFNHVVYSWTLPLLSGITVALYMASNGGDPEWIEAQAIAGNKWGLPGTPHPGSR